MMCAMCASVEIVTSLFLIGGDNQSYITLTIGAICDG